MEEQEKCPYLSAVLYPGGNEVYYFCELGGQCTVEYTGEDCAIYNEYLKEVAEEESDE